MKIRTDFVTNSSSSSFVIIHMKIEEIAKLLEKYRDADIPWNVMFEVEEDEIDIDPEDFMSTQDPTKVEEVLECLLMLLAEVNLKDVSSPDFPKGFYYNEDQVALMQEAFENRKRLTDSIQSVSWDAGLCVPPEEEGELQNTHVRFFYDREKGSSEFVEDAEW